MCELSNVSIFLVFRNSQLTFYRFFCLLIRLRSIISIYELKFLLGTHYIYMAVNPV